MLFSFSAAHAICTVRKVTSACVLNGKQSMISWKMLKMFKDVLQRGRMCFILVTNKLTGTIRTVCSHKIEETKGLCCRKLEKHTLTQANAALQTNVGHIFHWEQSGYQEDEPHFKLSGYNTIRERSSGRPFCEKHSAEEEL